jgi:nitrite reductase/ring-hydroxylating ferredoxin subunit
VSDEIGTTTRRGLLFGASAAGIAVTLAGCGSSDSGGSTSASSAIKTSDIPVGSGKIFDDVVVTQPAAGQFKAFDAHCTHMRCLVSAVDGGTIKCPCHGSTFSVTDGSATGGPAKDQNTGALTAKTATVNGDTITVS